MCLRLLAILLSLGLLSCAEEKDWKGQPRTMFANTSVLLAHLGDHLGKRVLVIGFVPDQSREVNIFELLPGPEHSQLQGVSPAVIMLYPRSERIHRQTMECYGAMVEVWGKVGHMYGLPAIYDVELVRCKGDENT